LISAGVQAAAIHGNKSQPQRTAALNAFRQGSTPVLVATDIAARGIDVSGVSHVFNFEMPNVSEQYVHRIGRTARAGADGVAISYVAPDERDYLRDIERLTKIKLFPQALPEDFLKEAARLPAPVRKPQELEQDARRDARDARGRGGPAARGQGGRNGGPNKNRSTGGQARDGQSRDQYVRNDRIAADRQGTAQRGPLFNPLGDVRQDGNQPQGERRPAPHRDAVRPARPQGDRPQGDRPRGDRPQGDRPYGDRPRTDRPHSDRPRTDRPQGDRPRGDRPQGDRPQGPRRQGGGGPRRG